MSFNSGVAAFNPAAPGAIGGTTPAAGTFTVVNLVDGSLNLRGVTSTTTGLTIDSSILRLIAGNTQCMVFTSTQMFNGVPFVASAGLFCNISGVPMYPVVGGSIFDYFTDGASASVDGTEDTLKTDTLPAGALNANGAKLRGYFQLSIVGHAVSTDRIRLYFGGTAIFDSGALNAATSGGLRLDFEIIRVSSTVVRCSVSCSSPIALFSDLGSQYTEVTSLTLSNTQIIKVTDISTGTNSAVGDVTVKLGGIWWHPASDIDGP